MRYEELVLATLLPKYLKPLHQRINKLQDELQSIKDHFGVDVVYEPGKLLVKPRQTLSGYISNPNIMLCTNGVENGTVLMTDNRLK